jgi:hypothetical protein
MGKGRQTAWWLDETFGVSQGVVRLVTSAATRVDGGAGLLRFVSFSTNSLRLFARISAYLRVLAGYPRKFCEGVLNAEFGVRSAELGSVSPPLLGFVRLCSPLLAFARLPVGRRGNIQFGGWNLKESKSSRTVRLRPLASTFVRFRPLGYGAGNWRETVRIGGVSSAFARLAAVGLAE